MEECRMEDAGLRKRKRKGRVWMQMATLALIGMVLVACAPDGGQGSESAAALEEPVSGPESDGSGASPDETQAQKGGEQESEAQEPKENPEAEEMTESNGAQEPAQEASEDEMPQEVNEDLKEFLAKEAKEEGKELLADGYTVKTMKAGQTLQDTEQGCIYVTFEAQYPKITIDSDSQTADRINSVIEAEILSRLGSLSEYEEWAKEEYTLREEIAKEQGEDILWQPYVAEVSYEVKRADDKILSLLLLDFNYLGGAHGGHGYTGLTFDMRTGEKLSLETIGESEQAVRDEVEPLLLQQAEQMQAAVEKGEGEIGLFEEYAEYMPDVLTDDTWYLTQDGMEVVANEYLIAPYAAGAITFEIPYEQAAFLKEQYLP